MTTTSNGNGVAGIAARLTDPKDRDTYTKIVSYAQALPPGDELRQLVELLGLVTLVGQQIPESVDTFLKSFRAEAAGAMAYQKALDLRLAKLPEEIASGVDVRKVATAMSESFRQQIAAIGLQDSTAALQGSVNQVKVLSAEFTAAVKPLPEQFRGISNALAADLAKLRTANNELAQHNARLIARADEISFTLKAAVVGLVFVVGTLCGWWYGHGEMPDCPAVSAPPVQAPAPAPPAHRRR